jgi:GNAT superfamily N-acetyltransferase
VPLVDVTITYLAMEHPTMFRPKRLPTSGAVIERIDPPSPAVAARYYRDVGASYQWNDSRHWSDVEWERELSREGSELWVLKSDGVEAGFFELVMPTPGVREIQYFGLLPGFEGKGLGSHLLSLAVDRAWEAGADKVILNTCTLDHPSALPNYLARGFEITGTRTEQRDLA